MQVMFIFAIHLLHLRDQLPPDHFARDVDELVQPLSGDYSDRAALDRLVQGTGDLLPYQADPVGGQLGDACDLWDVVTLHKQGEDEALVIVQRRRYDR
jgi:hypothetical protein